MIDPHSRGDLNCYIDQLVIEEIIMTSACGAITLKRRLPNFMANWTYKLRLLLDDFRWCCPLGLCQFHVLVSRDHYITSPFFMGELCAFLDSSYL